MGVSQSQNWKTILRKYSILRKNTLNVPKIIPNTFTTSYSQDPGPDTGTYSVSTDSVVTHTFDGPDGDVITGILSADGQTVIFGYSEYDSSQSYASLGIGVGVKRAVMQKHMSPATFLLLTE